MADAVTQVAGLLGVVANQLGRNLGVRIGPKRHSQAHQLATKHVRVDQRPVVCQSDDHVVDRGEVRLGGLPAAGARGPIAHVTYGDLPGHGRQVVVREDRAHQAQVLADQHGVPVAHGDARRLLAAVLQRAQGEVSQAGDVTTRSPDTEDAALLVQRVSVLVSKYGTREIRRVSHRASPSWTRRHWPRSWERRPRSCGRSRHSSCKWTSSGRAPRPG